MRKIIFLLLLLPFSSLNLYAQDDERPYLILVSYDGFRHDYVEKYDLKNFKKLQKEGSYAEMLVPSYPSKTFPNHYSIVTGMYPGTHGLVDNSFYDKKVGEIYTMRKRDMVEDPQFYGGIPIWVLTRQNDVKSASYFWVGSEAPVAGYYPNYYYTYDGEVPNEKRIEQAFEWLVLPQEDRPNLILLYFSLVDDVGHKNGPESKEIKATTEEADRLLGLIMAGIKNSNLPVNLVVTSDHGMRKMQTSKSNTIFLDKLNAQAEIDKIKVVSSGTHVHIYGADREILEKYYNQLNIDQARYDIYWKDDIPEKWHYQHERVGDLLLVAQPGYFFGGSAWFERMTSNNNEFWGTHGFDPYADPDMGGILYAWGPNIKNVVADPVENVNVYPLLAKILQLDYTHEIDGDNRLIKAFYKSEMN